MSYEIAKSIKIRDDKVYIVSACNNVRPRDYHEWEASSLSKILQEQGREAMDIELLKTVEGGSLQGSCGKYSRALKVLRHFEEYSQFDWRGEPYKEISERRKTEDFTDLLRRALKTKIPKNRFVIAKNEYGGLIYGKRSSRRMRWFNDRLKATLYLWKEDAEFEKKCYTNTEDWQVIQVK